MLIDIGFLILGLVLVVKGGGWFVDSSVDIARYLQIPRIVIGATIVSLATTMPELIVSATASFMKDSGIAIGNAVGSAICNIGLIVGIAAVMTTIEVDLSDFKRRFMWMLGSAVLMVIFAWNLHLGRLQGSILLLVGIAYLLFDYSKVRSERRGKNVSPNQAVGETPAKKSVGRSVILFAFGALLVILGSRFLVTSGIGIAKALGIPSVIIGLSIIAVGTSLPELVTAIAAARKKVPDLSVGNIVGANVLNLAVITGLAGVINPLTLKPFTRHYSFFWLFLFILAMGWFFRKKGSIAAREGWCFLIFYILYVAGLVLAPVAFKIPM